MKISLTGASGHLGATLCRKLIAKGHQVTILAHQDRTAVQELPVSIVEGNILDKSSLDTLTKNCDVLIHAAGMIDLSYKFNQKVYDVNVIGTQNIVEAVKRNGVSKMVHFSSIHVFQHKPYHLPIDENRSFVTNKSVFYDQTKRDAHILVQEAAKSGLDTVIVCPTSVVGPYDFKPSKLGKAIIAIYKGKISAIVKGGFDFADVRDIADGALAAMEKGRAGETYILGGKYYTIKELSDFVLKAKGTNKRLAELPISLAYVGLPFVKSYSYLTKKPPLYDKLYIDILQDGNKNTLSTKAQKELGYVVRPLEDTISDTIKWFKQLNKI